MLLQLFYFSTGISKVLGTTQAFHIEGGFWCLWQFYWSPLTASIRTLPYIL